MALTVTINDNLLDVKDPQMNVLAKVCSFVTRTDKVANTALDALPMLAVQYDMEALTAVSPALESFRNITSGDSIVHVEDEGETPRPRTFAFSVVIERIEALLKIAPHLQKVKELQDEVTGEIMREGIPSKGNKVSKNTVISEFTLSL